MFLLCYNSYNDKICNHYCYNNFVFYVNLCYNINISTLEVLYNEHYANFLRPSGVCRRPAAGYWMDSGCSQWFRSFYLDFPCQGWQGRGHPQKEQHHQKHSRPVRNSVYYPLSPGEPHHSVRQGSHLNLGTKGAILSSIVPLVLYVLLIIMLFTHIKFAFYISKFIGFIIQEIT